ncbi:MAG TPA: DUF3352 domain-containing protein, partial [Armatimonadota bacterium]|nr:DUF3352 domain-containing protein [Armatimonadota bacterium]
TTYRMLNIFALILMLGVHALAAQTTSFYGLVPQDTPVAMSVDIPWLWNVTANIRHASGWQETEKSSGFSTERDVLPWAGQAAIAITGTQDSGPTWAIYLQIRDADHMIDAAHMETIVQKMLAGHSKVTWLSLDYKGVAIRRFELLRNMSVLKVATATIDNWLVVTIGDGVIRKVIDTRQGDSPSLTTHQSFTKAMGGLPVDVVAEFCVNGQGIYTQLQQSDATIAQKLQNSELCKFFLAGSTAQSGDSLQSDLIYCTSSPTTQKTLKQLRADAGTVTGDSLTQLPKGTSAVMLVKNPDKWVGAVEQIAIDSASDTKEQTMLRQGFARYGKLREALQRCPGELGIGVGWPTGKILGLTMAGQAASGNDANTAANDLSEYLKGMKVIVSKANTLYTLPKTKSPGVLMCWEARKQWLIFATHPDWMKPATTPLTLPASVNNANLAALGDYTYLPQLLDARMDTGVTRKMVNSKLGQWVLTVKIDEDGGAVRCHRSDNMTAFSSMISSIASMVAQERGRARIRKSLDSLQQLVAVERMYAWQHHGRLPMLKTTTDIKELLKVSDAFFVSPRTNEPYAVNPFVAGKTWRSFKSPKNMIVFYENTTGRDGSRCVAYLDGHVGVILSAQWPIAKQRAHLP